ncbi:septum formation initiator family protein [Propionimicrobium sp. PCR01-08-3]|uniref:FtsB family cell division protein n=1 Tax=Propionimicrobium sp. PCR01-08-3 TaxID=3052086 RepID=UPI00255C4F4C|nr:septum formation initiator family protein [Propionimicrobium sp. PCR01-08-3]WIY83033.1 septum formation initiator family protein [Propionimicrobium sp. PCR01-08-3]
MESGRADRRTGSRPGGRARAADTPSTRTASRSSGRNSSSKTRDRKASKDSAQKTASTPSTQSAGENPVSGVVLRLRSGMRITQRAIILVLVMVVLLISYATTLRVYFNQQYQMGQARQAIAEHQQSITDLTDEIARWQDPEYVKTQARERLGWVMPGETGYQVVGPDNEPYAGGSQIGSAQLPEGEYGTTWWDRMWGSVVTADDPEPDEPDPGPVVTADPTEGP